MRKFPHNENGSKKTEKLPAEFLFNQDNRQLRIFDADGNWIHRVDFMVIAASSHEDIFSRESLCREMVREESENPATATNSLSPKALRRGRKEVAKRGNLHVLASSVVLEVARLIMATNTIPSLNAALLIVAFNQRNFQGKAKDSKVEKSVLREVERGFMKYRNIAHIRAAIEYVLMEDGEIGHGEKKFRRILGIARHFEEILDRWAAVNCFQWSPLRIPPQIEIASNLYFVEMTSQEIAAAGTV